MKDVVEIWANAIEKRNPKLMISMYGSDAILLATFSKDILIGHKEILNYFKSFLDKEGLVCTIIKSDVQTIGQNLSIVSGIYAFDYIEDDKPTTVLARFTYVILRNKIINHHSSVVPT